MSEDHESDSGDELPPGWEERVTEGDNRVVFVNHMDQKTQWTHPRTKRPKYVSINLPRGWRKEVNPIGEVGYVHDSGKRTTADPRLAYAQEYVENLDDFRQRFDSSSTALQVLYGLDLIGQTIVVTGGSAGIGFETVRGLVLHGARVILICRSLSSGDEVIKRLESDRPGVSVDVVQGDLSSLKSVRVAALQIRSLLGDQCLHGLILNAGVFLPARTLTEDGFEETFQVNHLSHVYLTLLLSSHFRRGSRVVVVSSESHRFSLISAESISPGQLSITSPGWLDLMKAYNDSKLMNLLMVQYLHDEWFATRGIVVNGLHPGNMVRSSLSRHSILMRCLFTLAWPFTKSMEQAAATTVFVMCSPDTKGLSGCYFNNCFPTIPSKKLQDAELVRKSWKVCMEMLSESSVKDFLRYDLPENMFQNT